MVDHSLALEQSQQVVNHAARRTTLPTSFVRSTALVSFAPLTLTWSASSTRRKKGSHCQHNEDTGRCLLSGAHRGGSREKCAQACPDSCRPINMFCPDIARRPCRAYRRAEMAEADDVVQLAVGELEKPLRFPVSVVLQTGRPKQRIVEGDRKGRIVAT